MSFEGHFNPGVIPRRASADPTYEPEKRDDALEKFSEKSEEHDEQREVRIGNTKDLMIEIRKHMQDRHEFSIEAKIAMLENIAEMGVESVLAEIAAERFGFPSFKAAMEEFGVYKNGATVYGEIVDKGNPETDLSRITRKSASDIKKGLVSGVAGLGVYAVGYTGLAALGLVAAPVFAAMALPAAVAVGASVLGNTVAKGIARHWTRKSLYQKQEPALTEPKEERPPAAVPEGFEWQGSVAQKAAEDMVSFIRECQLLAKQALKNADEQIVEDPIEDGGEGIEPGLESIPKEGKEGPVYRPQDIETYKMQQLNKIFRSLDTNIGPNGEQNIFANIGQFQQGIKKAEKTERWVGMVGGILAGGAVGGFFHSKIAEHVVSNAKDHLRDHGVYMLNGHLAPDHVGHLVKEVNGFFHYQVDTSYVPPTPDAGTAHGILDLKDLHQGSAAMNLVEQHLRAAHQTFFGNHVSFDSLPHDELIKQVTTAVTSPGVHQHGFSLTQETLAAAGNVPVYHAGTLDGLQIQNEVIANAVAQTMAQYAAIVGSVALAEPIGEAMVAGRESGIRAHIRKEGMNLIRMSMSSDIPEPPPSGPVGPDGSPIPAMPEAAKAAEEASAKKKEEEAEKKKETDVFDDFENKYMKNDDGSNRYNPMGKSVDMATTSHAVLTGETGVDVYGVDAAGQSNYADLSTNLAAKMVDCNAASTDPHNFVLMMPEKEIKKLGASKTGSGISTGSQLAAALMTDIPNPPKQSRDTITLVATGPTNKAPNNIPAWSEHLKARVQKRNEMTRDMTYELVKLD